jgi:hypothetical protein
MDDAFSEFGPYEESLFGKVPIWEAMILGKTFSRMMFWTFGTMPLDKVMSDPFIAGSSAP